MAPMLFAVAPCAVYAYARFGISERTSFVSTGGAGESSGAEGAECMSCRAVAGSSALDAAGAVRISSANAGRPHAKQREATTNPEVRMRARAMGMMRPRATTPRRKRGRRGSSGCTCE